MPVGGSVAEGVAILVLRGAMSESVERCLYEAAEHLGGGVGLPSRVCVRPLAACVVGWHYLAYKTTRKLGIVFYTGPHPSQQLNRH